VANPVLAASLGDISPVVEEFPVTYQGEQIATLVYHPGAVSPNSLAATARSRAASPSMRRLRFTAREPWRT
jgi:hypothetical protein